VWALSGGRFPLALGVLQVLALDIGTDILPAVALGAEPPSARALEKPPPGRHLIDYASLFRAFGLLGPVESVVEMMAFIAVLWTVGWRPGGTFPSGRVLLGASGAAFAAVVIGQMANAFACRSATHWPGSLGWATNRLLLKAVAVELLLLIAFLYLPPLALLLGQLPPNRTGTVVALLAAPTVLVTDAIHKRWKRRPRSR
jgi:magnesium-transporting ATPase (P-type)